MSTIRSTVTRAATGWLAPLVAVSLFVAACGGGGGPGTPTVTGFTPQNGAIAVAVGTDIRVTFSRAMNPSLTQAAFSSVPAIACTFGWNAANTLLTCDPTVDLVEGTLHTVTIAATAQSADGVNLAATVTSSFTTAEDDPGITDACVLGTARLGACRLGP